MQLRPYQQEAVDAVYRHLREHDDNPCIVIPTAGGKTPGHGDHLQGRRRHVGRARPHPGARQGTARAGRRQARRGSRRNLRVGVYSAGLDGATPSTRSSSPASRASTSAPATWGRSTSSSWTRRTALPPEGDGMYRQFLADMKVVNPRVRVIGLTATPFRMKSGMICAPENFLNAVCYEVGVRELIVDGYLCKLVTKAGCQKPDTSGLHVRAGEFVASEAEALMDQDALVESACAEIAEYTKRPEVLPDLRQRREARRAPRRSPAREDTEPKSALSSATPSRSSAPGCLTTSARGNSSTWSTSTSSRPASTRPTSTAWRWCGRRCRRASTTRWCGRGFRLHPGKQDCLVLDFGGNVLRHGPVDQIKPPNARNGNGEAPAKECPQCHSVIAAGYATCPDCGYVFPPPERQKHEGTASTAGILSGEVTTNEYLVKDVLYSVHTKNGAPPEHPKTLRVDYEIGFNWFISEWVCPEHTGYARWKFEKWWKTRSTLPRRTLPRKPPLWPRKARSPRRPPSSAATSPASSTSRSWGMSWGQSRAWPDGTTSRLNGRRSPPQWG